MRSKSLPKTRPLKEYLAEVRGVRDDVSAQKRSLQRQKAKGVPVAKQLKRLRFEEQCADITITFLEDAMRKITQMRPA